MMSNDEKARALFEKFHRRQPQGLELASLSFDRNIPILQVGHCWAISYVVKGGAKPFFHKFENRHRPLLYVSADGSEAFIIKGRWRFTERGFTG